MVELQPYTKVVIKYRHVGRGIIPVILFHMKNINHLPTRDPLGCIGLGNIFYLIEIFSRQPLCIERLLVGQQFVLKPKCHLSHQNSQMTFHRIVIHCCAVSANFETRYSENSLLALSVEVYITGGETEYQGKFRFLKITLGYWLDISAVLKLYERGIHSCIARESNPGILQQVFLSVVCKKKMTTYKFNIILCKLILQVAYN